MKALSIKLDIATAQKMDDRGELNPAFISAFIYQNFSYAPVVSVPEGLIFSYTFKVTDELHRMVKTQAARYGLSIGEYVRLLFKTYYISEV